MGFYKKDQIDAVYVEKKVDSNLLINVSPIMETFYYFAGVGIKEEKTSLELKLVRCKLKEVCSVDIVATPDTNTAGNYFFVLPNSGKDIFLNFDSQLEKIWPK